jgi:hypothetical protein
MKRLTILLIVAFFISSMNLFSQNKYVGLKTCISCHKGEKGKMVYENWLKTKHAQAFNTLKSEKSKEIAKKKNLKSDPTEAIECLKCHATGYFPGEESMATNKKEDGVTCEACHGPGSAYKTKHGKDKKDEGIKNGLIIGTNDEKICKKCHNPESPTFAGFNYKKDWEKVKH